MFNPGKGINAARAALRAARIALALICLNAVSGCAIPPSKATPATVAQPPPGDLQLVEALARPEAHNGATVRWGGNVIHVDHDSAGNATIQVIERRLDAQGRPVEGSVSDGRFVIKATADVDPQFYARDRLITVFGTIDGTTSTQVGDSKQSLPVIRVHDFMLWLPRWRDDPWRYHGHDHDRYGPNVRFGVGISNYHRHYH